jgi:hypothetical protein
VRAAQNGGEMNRRSCVLKRIGILPDLFFACVQRLLKVFNYAAGRRKNMNHENINHADLKLFREKFRPLYAAVKGSGFCRRFAAKKYRHSVQVLTIGREIAARDEQLKKEDAAFHALGEKALLFHDVGRFMEVYEMYRNNAFADHGSWFSKRCDHGLLSYEMMKNEPGYNDVRILAALKHHGHMMEEFYADPEFQDVADPETGRQLLAILFWVRDADKLANFYIQRYEDNLRKDPFFVTMSEEVRRAPLSPEAVAQFEAGQVILTGTVKSYCDRLLCCLSWIYDLNYKASYRLCAEHGYFDMLLELLAEYNRDTGAQEKIARTVRSFLAQKII